MDVPVRRCVADGGVCVVLVLLRLHMLEPLQLCQSAVAVQI